MKQETRVMLIKVSKFTREWFQSDSPEHEFMEKVSKLIADQAIRISDLEKELGRWRKIGDKVERLM